MASSDFGLAQNLFIKGIFDLDVYIKNSDFSLFATLLV